ncbi:MAG: tetratricopeptide repeat protein [Candidatus Riflebacteria bacterium]|nr:tetratricopeptide repeat protein [Candidatus Riflebacteria bacterium]
MKRFARILLAVAIAMSVQTSFAAKKGTVTGSYIQVRETSSLSSPVIGKKLRGEKYTIVNQERGWIRVKFEDGLEGWIYGKSGSDKSDELEGGEGAGTASQPEPMSLPSLPDLTASGTASTGSDSGKIGSEKNAAKTGEKTVLKADQKTASGTKDKDADKDKEKGKKDKDKTKDKTKDKGHGKDAREGKESAFETKEADIGKASIPGEGTTKQLSSSKSAEEYYNEGIELFERKQYAAALEANKNAFAQAPKNAEILNNLGNCLFKLDRVEDAIGKWREALSISPKSAKICNNLAIAFYQNDDNARAIEYYKKAILFEPQFPDPYYNLASVYGFKGQFAEAQEFYQKYLEFSPDPTMKRLTEERIDYCKKQLASAAKKDKSEKK